MYAVSEEYMIQMNKPDVSRVISGTIAEVSFSGNDIVRDSIYISNQCSESGEIKLGSVYTAALECTFREGLVERESWKGLEVVISEGIYLEDGETVETVPLGVFYVDEATHVEKGVAIKAYDAMLSFEKAIGLDTTYGTPYDMAKYACDTCGVELGMTREQIRAFPNGNKELQLYTENDIETWRDLLFWIAQTCGAFWTINREGKLEMRSFGMTVENTVTSNLRYKNAAFSDFTTAYTGISCIDKKNNQKSYYNILPDDKLTYELGANPFLQYDSDQEREQKCRNILNSISSIEYVPFSARVLQGAAYDLGDIIHFTGGRADDSKVCCVMFWDYNGKGYNLEGFGSDPATADARSKTDKELAGILSQARDDKIQFYSFFNTKAVHIADGETKPVIEIRFTANKQTTVVFHAEILMDVDTTVNGNEYKALTLNVLYLYDDVDMEHYKPKGTWFDGNHILHLLYYFDINEFTLHNLKVLLNTDGASIDIGLGEIRASVWGQNLAAVDHWDGTITVREETGVANLIMPALITGIGIGAESVSTQFITPDEATVTQIAGLTTLIMPPSITTMNPTETISVSVEEVTQ